MAEIIAKRSQIQQKQKQAMLGFYYKQKVNQSSNSINNEKKMGQIK